MRVFTRNQVSLHFREDGDLNGPPMVFLNSLATDFRVWDLLLPHLAPGHRIIRLDKRGHGLSDGPPPPYRMDDHVDDVIGLLDQLGVQKALVVGLSIGGMIAQGVAIKRPELVRGLALVCTAPRIGDAEMWNARIQTVESGGLEALADAIMTRWFSEAFRANSAALAPWRNMFVRTAPDGYIGSSAALRDCDYTEAVRRIDVPTVCIAGSEDGSTPPAMVRAAAALIPNAAFEVIEGVGHIPCVEAPADVARLIEGLAARAQPL